MVKLLKAIVAAGAAAGAADLLLGNYFIENNMSKKGIKKTIEAAALSPSEESACFYFSDEAVKGIEFYRKTLCSDISTVNRSGETVYADYYSNEKPSNVYVISCHGYTGLPSQNSIFTMHFLEMGFNVLLPYLRGHGISEHDYCTMGWLERLDIIDWINYIIKDNHDAKIILHGASMGAATVMMATGENLPENVICCIEDCGYTSLWDQYSIQIKNFTSLPPEIILNFINPVFKIKFGFDIKQASAVNQVKKSKTPTLFIHGDKDLTVPFSMLNTLYENAGCEKEKLVVENATHAASGYCYPEIYWNAVSRFINKYI